MELSTELILGLVGLGGTGGLGGVIMGIIKYKTSLKNRERTIIKAISEKDSLNYKLLNEVVINLQEMRNTLHMGFRHKVRDSHQEIMTIKDLAWSKQQDDLYNGLKVIIKNNGLNDKPARVSDIRDLLETVIRATDSILNSFNLKGYVAPTEAKIKYVNSGPAPEVLYKIITDEKNRDCHKLEDSVRLYGQKILNSIKMEFYDSDNKVKVRSAEQRAD